LNFESLHTELKAVTAKPEFDQIYGQMSDKELTAVIGKYSGSGTTTA
jgi:hypothetical protein